MFAWWGLIRLASVFVAVVGVETSSAAAWCWRRTDVGVFVQRRRASPCSPECVIETGMAGEGPVSSVDVCGLPEVVGGASRPEILHGGWCPCDRAKLFSRCRRPR